MRFHSSMRYGSAAIDRSLGRKFLIRCAALPSIRVSTEWSRGQLKAVTVGDTSTNLMIAATATVEQGEHIEC